MNKPSHFRQTDEEKEQQEREKAEKRDKAKQIHKDINETFATPSGMRTLRWMMNLCGYQRSSVVVDPTSGEVQINSTVYNEARRVLYLNIRQPIKQSTLRLVENEGLMEDIDDLFT